MVVWVESSLVWWGKHFLPVSRWDGDVLHSELGQANVLRTQHLGYSVFESETIQPCPQSFLSDVEWTVSRSHITYPDQKNIYQSPNTQASKTEQFTQTLSPLAQIKSICPKTTECNATERDERKSKMLREHKSWFNKDFLRLFTASKPVITCRLTWVLMLLTICILQSSCKINVSENVFYLQEEKDI